MKKLVYLSLLAVISVAIGACGGKKVDIEETKMTKNEFVTFNVTSLKNKGKKYDVEVEIKNTSEKDIIIMLADMECFKGNTQGVLKHTFFNTGERTIDFRTGQMKRFRMVCTLDEVVSGNYRIVINRIYDNPNADGATKGTVVAKGIELKMSAD